jgi:DNA-binding response OmpR family regulator
MADQAASAAGDVRILVVEDTATMLILMVKILERAGYRVVATGDPRQVLPLAAEDRPDLVLVDLFMPHLDGLAVAAALGAAHGEDAPPVVLLTGEDTDDIRRRAAEAGIRAVLCKPYGIDDLLACVTSVLAGPVH